MRKATFVGIRNIDQAIHYLEQIKQSEGGETLFTFGDGSPVSFVVTDERELTSEKHKTTVQVRLDR